MLSANKFAAIRWLSLPGASSNNCDAPDLDERDATHHERTTQTIDTNVSRPSNLKPWYSTLMHNLHTKLPFELRLQIYSYILGSLSQSFTLRPPHLPSRLDCYLPVTPVHLIPLPLLHRAHSKTQSSDPGPDAEYTTELATKTIREMSQMMLRHGSFVLSLRTEANAVPISAVLTRDFGGCGIVPAEHLRRFVILVRMVNEPWGLMSRAPWRARVGKHLQEGIDVLHRDCATDVLFMQVKTWDIEAFGEWLNELVTGWKQDGRRVVGRIIDDDSKEWIFDGEESRKGRDRGEEVHTVVESRKTTENRYW